MKSHDVKLVKIEDQFYDSYGLFFGKLIIDGKEQRRRLLFKNVGNNLVFIGHVGKNFWLLPNSLAQKVVEDALRDYSSMEFSLHKKAYADANEVIMSASFVSDKRISITGETYNLGIHFMNSEDGSCSFRVGGYIMRQVCKNGMSIHKDIVRHRILHIASAKTDYNTMIDKVKKLVESVIHDEENVVKFLEHTTNIKLDDKLFNNIKRIVPMRYLRETQVAEKIAGELVYDESMTLYDVLCKVTEYATHRAKKEHQLFDVTSRLAKVAYDAVRHSSVV